MKPSIFIEKKMEELASVCYPGKKSTYEFTSTEFIYLRGLAIVAYLDSLYERGILGK